MRRVIALVLLIGGCLLAVGPSTAADEIRTQAVFTDGAPVYDPAVACPPSDPCGNIESPDALAPLEYYHTAEYRITGGLVSAAALLFLATYIAGVRAYLRHWRTRTA